MDRQAARSEPAMSASLDVRTWLRTSMSILLGFPCDEVADYVLTLPSLDTMREHIESFAGEVPPSAICWFRCGQRRPRRWAVTAGGLELH